MLETNLPISEYLTQINETLKNSKTRSLILTAETGAGKSTLLPIGLLQGFEGKILMTEPRKLAVLGVANRISELLEEECGQTAGYRIHLENKTSDRTRLEIMTEGILIKILQDNPELEGYNLVVLDEAHERSVNFDLALAFLKEALELRDDLFVVIMSATINCKKMSDFLNGAPIMEIPGRTFPVEVEYDTKSTVEQAIIKEINELEKGTILTFFPGISDIRKCEANLKERLSDKVELMILHSSVSLEDQKKVLKPAQDSRVRVVLSSAIAETSITVPDVVCVIDTGFSRVSRINIATGMPCLETERESEFSADQRKGRAGRVQKGKCVRLWSEHDVRIKELAPEISRCDLSNLVLECAERGITDSKKISWLDEPNFAEWKESTKLLQELGFLEDTGRITEKGRFALKLGLSPRLANLAIEGYIHDEEGKIYKQLLLKYSEYQGLSDFTQKKFISDIENRLSRIPEELKTTEKVDKKNLLSYLILCGYPDRVAKKISKPGDSKIEFQFPNGKKATLPELKSTSQWIVVPELLSGTTEAKIFEFEQISDEFLQIWIKNRLKLVKNVEFSEKKVRKTEDLCFGKIVISSKNLPAEASDYVLAWISEVQNKGIDVLPKDKKTESLLQRTAFYWQQTKNLEDAEKKLEEFLMEKAEEWLKPFITGTDLSSQNVYEALTWFLNGTEIDKEVPEIFILPNGNKAKVKYEKLASEEDRNILVLRPVIEIIIQRIFGCFETPVICGRKVLLRLLSPASRPLQITDDLENFWKGTWSEICKEMKGRYPKHNWDYKIAEKE